MDSISISKHSVAFGGIPAVASTAYVNVLTSSLQKFGDAFSLPPRSLPPTHSWHGFLKPHMAREISHAEARAREEASAREGGTVGTHAQRAQEERGSRTGKREKSCVAHPTLNSLALRRPPLVAQLSSPPATHRHMHQCVLSPAQAMTCAHASAQARSRAGNHRHMLACSLHSRDAHSGRRAHLTDFCGTHVVRASVRASVCVL